jgi:hypothetical protein
MVKKSLRRSEPKASFFCQGRIGAKEKRMSKFMLWLILLVICWPLALLAILLYPLVWLLVLPFRLLGIAVGGVFELLRALITLPVRILRGPRP